MEDMNNKEVKLEEEYLACGLYDKKRKLKKYTWCLSVREEQDAQQRTDEVQGGQTVNGGERNVDVERRYCNCTPKCRVKNRTVKSCLVYNENIIAIKQRLGE